MVLLFSVETHLRVKVFSSHYDARRTRFTLYAPLVKFLRINKKYKGLCKVRGWRSLFQRIRNRALLPNLKTLRIDQYAVPSPVTQCTQSVMWTIALLSPSLEAIDLICEDEEEPVPVTYLAALAIMDAILKVCPTVQKLSLFPTIEIHDESDEYFPLVNLLDTKPLLSYFSELRNLTELVTSSHMITSEALQVLGELPRLKRLSFQRDFIEDIDIPGDFPDNAFPVLEHLPVWLEFYQIEEVLGFMPLVRNITSLVVTTKVIDYSDAESDDDDDDENMVERLFRCLENIPHLKNLDINLGDTEYLPLGPRDISPHALYNILCQLSLRVVSLRDLIFGDVDVLGTTFPVLSKLTLHNQPGPLSTIPRYSAMPGLEHLGLLMTTDDKIPTKNDIPTFQSLHTLEFIPLDPMPYSGKQRRSIAKYGFDVRLCRMLS